MLHIFRTNETILTKLCMYKEVKEIQKGASFSLVFKRAVDYVKILFFLFIYRNDTWILIRFVWID